MYVKHLCGIGDPVWPRIPLHEASLCLYVHMAANVWLIIAMAKSAIQYDPLTPSLFPVLKDTKIKMQRCTKIVFKILPHPKTTKLTNGYARDMLN